MKAGFYYALGLLLVAGAGILSAQSLPGTTPLEAQGDYSAAMVSGIDRMALRLIDASRASRKPNRETLKNILGLVDVRLPVVSLESVGDSKNPALLAENDEMMVTRVRWRVLDGVAGEGIHIRPKGRILARVICLPDADTEPEQMVSKLAWLHGCEIIIPALISRSPEFSDSPRLGIKTNVPHREWIYRQSFVFGRHIIGYELQKTLALVDWCKALPDQKRLIVAGYGEGGLLALHAAALDPRIDGAFVRGYFGPREGVWAEPIDRNIFGLLRDFGDAEVASLIAPRPLVISNEGFPVVSGPPTVSPGRRAIAAPGRVTAPDWASVQAEGERARRLVPGDWLTVLPAGHLGRDMAVKLLGETTAQEISSQGKPREPMPVAIDVTRQERQVRELGAYSQKLIGMTETERDRNFWKKLPVANVAEFAKYTANYRSHLAESVIGKLPDPNVPMNARSRFLWENDKVRAYEVTLDVWDGVMAWGWLCVPKDIGSDERRPVVVCQHGLEGLPSDVFTADPKAKAFGYYQAFALRLAEQGYVTFAPHNPYRGFDAFRTLQRKLNPLGLTLYSVINGQHQRILEWLGSQPFVHREKIAFYGLSYGGKSAMRTPALLPEYCLSICSGDFNEWIRKCVSDEMPMSYLFAPEYEIWEWNLARQANYAEMAALIAPRPFMVERGHRDGVGTDEWVSYEYAKVRRLYDVLGIPARTRIEYFNAGHMIHGVGTFEFLHEHLPVR